MTEHKIVVAISEAAQRQAARKGEPAQAVQCYGLSTEQVGAALDLGAQVGSDGSVTLRCGVRHDRDERDYDHSALASHLQRRPVDAADALALVREIVERQREATAAKARAAVACYLDGSDTQVHLALAQNATTDLPEPERVAALARIDVVKAERDAAKAERDAAAKAMFRAECVAWLDRLEVDCSPAVAADGKWRVSSIPGAPRASGDSPIHGDGCLLPDDLRPRLKAIRERYEAAQEAARIVRLQRLADLVREHGDGNACERVSAYVTPEYPLGMLSAGEAVEIVCAHYLPAALPGLREYEIGEDDDVRETCGEDCACGFGRNDDESCSVSWRALPVENVTLSAAQWAELRALEAAVAARFASGVTELRLHRGTCDSAECDAGKGAGIVERLGALVRVDLGRGVVVEREYASVRER